MLWYRNLENTEVLQISELPPHTLLYEPEEHVEIGGQVEEGEEGGGRLLDTQNTYKGPPTKELWHLRNILFKFQYQNSRVPQTVKKNDKFTERFAEHYVHCTSPWQS